MINFYNILMVKSTKKFSFLPKEGNYLIRSFFFFQHLDRHYLIIWYEFRSVNFAKRAFAYFLIKLIQFLNTIINIISMSLGV